jgi:hypothetical protein
MTTMSSISSALSGLQKADQMLLGAAQAVNGGLDNMAEAAVQLQTAQVQASASLELLRTSLELEGQIVDLLA